MPNTRRESGLTVMCVRQRCTRLRLLVMLFPLAAWVHFDGAAVDVRL